MGLELEAGELGSRGAGTRIGHVFYILKSVQVSYLFIYIFIYYLVSLYYWVGGHSEVKLR